MNHVRFGIIGVGNMGTHHLGTLRAMDDVELTALCDIDPHRLAPHADQYRTFASCAELFDSGLVDAVIIATPHYDHPPIARAAFERGLHVLSEKPVAVDIREARRISALHQSCYAHLKYGAMFQMRTCAMFRKIRQLILEGELGEISRITWIVTDWFRTWTYYASGGWRATWKGEGGGVLLNQCPHNLDLIQWLLGGMMPKRITAVASIGKTHPIEVEDEISATLEYANGAVGHFITTTGEAPGSNRLEIAGDRGLLVCEGGKLRFGRTCRSVRETREKSPDAFVRPPSWDIDVQLPAAEEGWKVIIGNFADAIRTGAPLIAPAEDGLKSLEMGNAMLMAGLTRQPVELPLNGDAYHAFLMQMIEQHGDRQKQVGRVKHVDMAASFMTTNA